MPVDLSGTLPLGGGLHGKPGTDLTPVMLNVLRWAVARTNMDVVATSGQRTAQAQARAWKAKLDLGQTQDDLRRLYKRDDLVDEVFEKSDLSVQGMTAVFQAQMDRGDYISSHMSGLALDLRVRGYADEELEKLDAVLAEGGVRVVKEASPPHWHLELLGAKTDRAEPRTSSRTVSAPRRRTR